MFSHSARASFVLCLSAAVIPIGAQSPSPADYTLHTDTRVVLTDVTVTDAQGNPVRGLDRSAFHIFDNNHPQDLASFHEHTGAQSPIPTSVPSAPQKPHTFSNDFLLYPPPVFNVLVLDTATIGIADQMYLYQQLTRFIAALPAGEQLAVFVHSSESTLLLQDFTVDHALLLDAVRAAIPQFQQHAWNPQPFDGLQAIATYLGQLPGRKNVLWFTAGTSLLLRVDATTLTAGEDLRPLCDQLEASRIALYPIDVRGLGMGSVNFSPDDEAAKATGGQAFYNNNAIAQIAAKVIATDASFYTLSYSPHGFQFDNKWHKVKVKVDGGPYALSYRTGYYGDGFNTASSKTSRTLLSAAGEKVHLPENRSAPIIFRAVVEPSATPAPAGTPSSLLPPRKKNETTYTVRYYVPAAAFTTENAANGQRVEIGAGALAFNRYGDTVKRVLQKFTLDFSGNKLRDIPTATLTFVQQLNLPKGQDYLSLAVWDFPSGRTGMIQLPLNVEKHADAKP